MEPKRLSTRALLQRVVTLTKHAHDLQSSSSTLTVPIRPSYWKRQASTNSDTSGTNGSAQLVQPPTYALGPQRKFDFARVKKILQSELDERCSKLPASFPYHPRKCRDLVRDLAQHLRTSVKPELLSNLRYKLIVLVTIAQVIPDPDRRHSIAMVSRCLWDHDTDGSITVRAPIGSDMHAIATVFAVYTT